MNIESRRKEKILTEGEERIKEDDEKIIKVYLTLVASYCKQYQILLELMTVDDKADFKKTIKEVYFLLQDR